LIASRQTAGRHFDFSPDKLVLEVLGEIFAESCGLGSWTIAGNGIAQPKPRPFQASGHSAIDTVDITAKG
jgi:hypothetical protein